ncbi:DinB family protein [Pontibacter silvestris]|uniref:DinB family protein n=1 Tax=Pontibacter silvestris TaxID=2305183 RepID=A0ABW4X3J4_9BACT|nr:DinB family protein [Pontibacter silvestris]MCC9135871.1 DinB family protein [Pontibacter silvestris]
MGHIIVAQQVLIYISSDLEGYISEELLNLYRPGTKPAKQASDTEVNELKELLISLIERTESDFFDGKFIIYNERTTSMGFHLASLKEALEYNNYHEGLHLGYMMNIRKLV